MSNTTILETGLRDGDVIEVFLNLLSNERSHSKTFKLDFDSIITDIKIIRDALDKNKSPKWDSLYNNPVMQIDLEKLVFDIYVDYLRSHSANESETDWQLYEADLEKIYPIQYYNFKKNMSIYIQTNLDLIYNSYLRNAISLVLDKYLGYFESFGFIKDNTFNNLFGKYVKYLRQVVENVHLIPSDSQYKLHIILDNVIAPFFGYAEFYSEIEEKVNINKNYKSAYLNLYTRHINKAYNRFISSEIAEITRNMSEKVLDETVIKYSINDNYKEDKVKESVYKEFDLSITLDSEKDTDCLFSLYLITKSLESIKGVKIDIINLEKGSVRSRIKATIKMLLLLKSLKL